MLFFYFFIFKKTFSYVERRMRAGGEVGLGEEGGEEEAEGDGGKDEGHEHEHDEEQVAVGQYTPRLQDAGEDEGGRKEQQERGEKPRRPQHRVAQPHDLHHLLQPAMYNVHTSRVRMFKTCRVLNAF